MRLKYGSKSIELDVKGEILNIQDLKPINNIKEALINNLNNPINSEPLKEIIKGSRNVLIIICDKTRQCRNDLILPILINEINKYGISNENIKLLTANGTHMRQTQEELKEIVGEEIFGRIEIFQHNAKDNETLIDLGKTSRGTPILVNKKLKEFGKIIVIGRVLPHYFAGFGGSRKVIAVGVTGYETIIKNHSLSINKDSAYNKDCALMKLEGNPLNEDIVEITSK